MRDCRSPQLSHPTRRIRAARPAPRAIFTLGTNIALHADSSTPVSLSPTYLCTGIILIIVVAKHCLDHLKTVNVGSETRGPIRRRVAVRIQTCSYTTGRVYHPSILPFRITVLLLVVLVTTRTPLNHISLQSYSCNNSKHGPTSQWYPSAVLRYRGERISGKS